MAHPAERTIALLAFEDVKAAPMADLLDIAQRQKTASELNAAILASQDLVRCCATRSTVSAAQQGAQAMHMHARAAVCCGGCCCSHGSASALRKCCFEVISPSCFWLPSPFCSFQEPEPRLPGLLKMLLWAQQRLEERVEFPKCAMFAAQL